MSFVLFFYPQVFMFVATKSIDSTCFHFTYDLAIFFFEFHKKIIYFRIMLLNEMLL